MTICDVSERLKLTFEINHYCTQILTEHGNFGNNLHRFGMKESKNCTSCNVVVTPEHVIYDCWRHIEERMDLIRKLSEMEIRVDKWLGKRQMVRLSPVPLWEK